MSTEATSIASGRLAISAAEVAKLLGISERHLWTMHSSGRLGPMPMRFGRAVRWSIDELRAWINAGSPTRDRWQAMRKAG